MFWTQNEEGINEEMAKELGQGAYALDSCSFTLGVYVSEHDFEAIELSV